MKTLNKIAALGLAGLIGLGSPALTRADDNITVSSQTAKTEEFYDSDTDEKDPPQKSFGIKLFSLEFRSFNNPDLPFPDEIKNDASKYIVRGENYEKEIKIDLPETWKWEWGLWGLPSWYFETGLFYKNDALLNLELLCSFEIMPFPYMNYYTQRYWPWGKTDNPSNPYEGSEVAYIHSEVEINGPLKEFNVSKRFRPSSNDDNNGLFFDIGAGISKSNMRAKFGEGVERYAICQDEKEAEYDYSITAKRISFAIGGEEDLKNSVGDCSLKLSYTIREYLNRQTGDRSDCSDWNISLNFTTTAIKLWSRGDKDGLAALLKD